MPARVDRAELINREESAMRRVLFAVILAASAGLAIGMTVFADSWPSGH